MKSVQIRSSFGVNLRIQSEYRKIQTRENSVFGHFSRSEDVPIIMSLRQILKRVLSDFRVD